MPEGHTIHRVAFDHQQWFAGQRLLVVSPQGRFEEGAKVVSGKRLKGVEAHGKHLFYRWSSKLILHVHLGLYGKFRVFQSPPPDPRGAVRVRMVGTDKTFDLVGPNTCELINQREADIYRSNLGEDPLGESASCERVWLAIQNSRSSIGSLLLNQKVIAGIGNIYRAEILFLMGIHPEMPARNLTKTKVKKLWSLTRKLMKIGVEHKRIITVGITRSGRVSNSNNERFYVYKRSACSICQSPIESWQLANRTIYACPCCQEM